MATGREALNLRYGVGIAVTKNPAPLLIAWSGGGRGHRRLFGLMCRVFSLGVLLSVSFGALLSGCATQSQTTNWTRANTSREQFEMDKAACQMEVLNTNLATSGTGWFVRAEYANQTAVLCMKSRGYVLAGQ